MSQLVKIRDVLRFKNSINYVSSLNHQLNRNYQTALAKSVRLDQINNEATYDQLNNDKLRENLKSIKNPISESIVNSKKSDKPHIEFPPKFNPDPSPNLNKPTREQLDLFHKYIEEKVCPKFSEIIRNESFEIFKLNS